MTTYLTVLIVLFGLAIIWKSTSMVGVVFASARLSRLRDKVGILSLGNSGKHAADIREADAIIASCHYMVTHFSIRKFISAIVAVHKGKGRDRIPHKFSDPEIEKLADDALMGTMMYLPMLSLSLFLILVIVGFAVFVREGYGVGRQTIESARCYIVENGPISLNESRRVA